MKTLLRLSMFLFAAVLARADVIIEQKMESAFMNGNMTMKIKGEQARMDIPAPNGGMTVIMNLKSGEMASLLHGPKMAVKMTLADAKKAAEAQQKAAGMDLNKMEKPKSTGQKEKIGDWDCEIFDVNMGGITGKMWVAKDFPNGKAIMDQMNKINSAASAGMGMDPSKFDLGGMTVKSEMTTPAGKVSTTLVKVTEENVPDAEFNVPTDYKVMPMPGR